MKTPCKRAAAIVAAATVLLLARAEAAAPDAAADMGRYGSPAHDLFYDREIRLRPDTRSVGVWRLETIRFVTAEGREFRWRFDSIREMDVFPLNRIAPGDVQVPAATVYVNGEIPIAP